MAIAIEVTHNRHQQRLTRQAGPQKQFALVEGIDLAITFAVIGIVPVIKIGAPMIHIAHRLDKGVHLAVDLVQFMQHSGG